jgi:hypothetical protein
MKRILAASIIGLAALAACNTNSNSANTITSSQESDGITLAAVGPLTLTLVSSSNTNGNSAARLTDGLPARSQSGVYTNDDAAWLNTNPYAPNNATYPMTATFDLGASKSISGLEYFVGNIPGNGEVEFVLSNTVPTANQARTTFKNSGNNWGTWVSVPLNAQNARYVMLRFANSTSRFNISELRAIGETGTGGGTGGTGGGGPTPTGTFGSQNECRPTSAAPCDDLPTQAISSMAMQALIQIGGNDNDAFRVKTTPNTATCQRLHNRFWTTGPDGKAYPTWHPPTFSENGTTCKFGHEHGDNPWQSAFYQNRAKYIDLWVTHKQLPIPFGYASQVLMDTPNGGVHRHEDHTGHKIFWERFEITKVNMANHINMDANANRTGITCDGLVKIHMGSSTSDALVSHLHEMATHFDCTGSKTFRSDVTVLSPLSLPGSFTNTCTNGGVIGVHASVGANQKYPITTIATNPVTDGSSVGNNLSNPGGDRIIPQAGCVHTYAGPATAPNPRGYNPGTQMTTLQAYFGHDMLELWANPVLLTSASGGTGAFGFSPYVQVLNPARVTKNNDWSSSLYNCSLAPTNPLQRSEICARSLNGTSTTVSDSASDANWSSPGSKYNGTVRTLNLKKIRISNTTGSSDIQTDAFGRTTTAGTSIHQFVSNGVNFNGGGAEGFDADMGSLPAPSGGNNVCQLANGGQGRSCNGWKMFPELNGKSVTGNQNALEWFRDYSDSDGVHAPN